MWDFDGTACSLVLLDVIVYMSVYNIYTHTQHTHTHTHNTHTHTHTTRMLAHADTTDPSLRQRLVSVWNLSVRNAGHDVKVLVRLMCVAINSMGGLL